jgi:hypothetical protein
MTKLELNIELNQLFDYIDGKLYECDSIKGIASGKSLHQTQGYEEALKDLAEFLKQNFK